MRSFYYAFRGLLLLFRSQKNARIHLFFFFLAICSGFIFKSTALEWSLILICSGLDHHAGIGESKDIAASAVLITAIAAFSVGLIIFIPKLVSWTIPN